MWRSLKCIRKKIEGREGGREQGKKEGRKMEREIHWNWSKICKSTMEGTLYLETEDCIWGFFLLHMEYVFVTFSISASLIIAFELLNPIAQIFQVFRPSFNFSIALFNIWYTMYFNSWPSCSPLLECKLIEGTNFCLFCLLLFLVSKRVFDTS